MFKPHIDYLNDEIYLLSDDYTPYLIIDRIDNQVLDLAMDWARLGLGVLFFEDGDLFMSFNWEGDMEIYL